MYSIKSNPCGMPSNFTYSGFPDKYFIGVAINSNKIYDMPSRKATILKIVTSENMTLLFSAKVVHKDEIEYYFKCFLKHIKNN